jgi:hypothetical protein
MFIIPFNSDTSNFSFADHQYMHSTRQQDLKLKITACAVMPIDICFGLAQLSSATAMKNRIRKLFSNNKTLLSEIDFLMDNAILRAKLTSLRVEKSFNQNFSLIKPC